MNRFAIRVGRLAGVISTIVVGAWPATAWSYTMEQQQACMGDAFRLCGSDIPDVDRVTACMVRQRSQLSPGCRAFFREPARELTPVMARKPLVIEPRLAAKARKPHKLH